MRMLVKLLFVPEAALTLAVYLFVKYRYKKLSIKIYPHKYPQMSEVPCQKRWGRAAFKLDHTT